MKGMKGRFLRKFRAISTISTLKQGLVLQLNPSEKYSNLKFQSLVVSEEHEQTNNNNNHPEVAPGHVSLSDLLNDREDEETESSFPVGYREILRPPMKSKFSVAVPPKDQAETAVSSEFGCEDPRTVPLPEADSSTELKACNFEKTAIEKSSNNEANESNEESASLLEFEEKCPPGGSESVILYTTSFRGIRKTFEDCNSIRFLLESFRVLFCERDVAMHLEFREELWRILEGRVVPPRLFIKGRHIGGADEVVGLHEQGKLRKLLQGIPLALSDRSCGGCAGVRFVVCSDCNGSCKVFADGSDEMFMRCPQCNENGLVKCPICC